MHRTTLLAAAAGITLGAGLLIPALPASAHTGSAKVTEVTCLDPATRSVRVRLTVTADVPDLNPVPTIWTKDGRIRPPMVKTGDNTATYSGYFTGRDRVRLNVEQIIWSDGFTKTNVGAFDIPAPDDCTPPASSTTTTVPPVDTTTPGTTVPESPTTTVPAGPTTTARICEDGNPPSVVLEDGSIVCPEYGAPVDQPTTTTAAVTGGQAQPPTPRAPIALPATGAGEIATVIGTGVVLALCGVVAVMIDRRKRAHIDR